ncbi:MAG TPA: hypothetical protein VLL75_17820 [Vicinamibacteria bacterium]|nr:hypothetical protein [Vicinamibacteria bacterium]
MRRAAAAALLAFAAARAASGGEVPGAAIVLEADPGTPGSDPAGAPPRFVLMRDGEVFVGGTARLAAGRLDKGESSALLKRADAVRRLRGLASPVSLGGEASRMLRLRLLDGKPLELVVNGDPEQAPPALAPLASLLADLLRYHHPSLRPYQPTSYAMTVREARLVGGCRPWGFTFPITEALAGLRTVTAEEANGWPTGARPASVCVDSRRYAVLLRPLLPGERP